MSATGIAYGCMWSLTLSHIQYCDILPLSPYARPLSPYAMSGTEIRWLSICLRTHYAISGTEIAYGRRSSSTAACSGWTQVPLPDQSLFSFYCTVCTDIVVFFL
eukprot:3940411-Rhodomonas_salina.3